MESKRLFDVGAVLGITTVIMLAALAAAGWVSGDRGRPESPTGLPDASMILVNGYAFDCLAGEPDLPDDLVSAAPTNGLAAEYLVHVCGRMMQHHADRIVAAGGDIVTYVPNNAYEVRMTPSQASAVSALPFVDWVGAYHPAYKVSRELAGGAVTVTLEGGEISRETLQSVRSELALIGEGKTTTGYVFHGRALHDGSVERIAALPNVQFISDYIEPELWDEAGSQIVGGFLWYNDPDSNPSTPYRALGSHGGYANQLGYDGAGITLGIADTGLGNGAAGNAGHNDFTGRVLGGHSFGGGAWSDGHGHGTHCAGLAVADSFEGNGVTYSGYGPYYAAQGLGHEANLYAEKIFSDAGGWIGPADYGQILEVGWAGGAVVHTNSWGSASGGAYGAADQAYDTKARDAASGTPGNQNMVIFVAAGNSYSLNTIGSPGNGKNVITVGATENYIPDSMARGNTDENGDNPDGITDFSSKGWTDDGRIKPDISTPGRATLSTRSPNVASSNLYGFYTPDTRYEWCSGTSQACPTAAGAGIAVMDWYNTVYGTMPTPSMVKALLINSAVDIPDEDNNGNPNNAYPIPNQYEGWGRAYIPTVVDPSEPWLVYDAPTELTTGTFDEYTFTHVNSGRPVKITLAYTDVYALSGASVTLINNLNLQVTSPSGDVYHGNAFSGGLTPANTNPSATFDTDADGWDDRNNVECVYIAPGDLESGLYTVRVTGFGVPGDCDNDGSNDQDYSLVIHNAQDVTSYGVVDIQHPEYLRESSVQVSVMDMDLNTDGASVQTATINVASLAEPAGESLLLTETDVDTGVFRGFLTISGTNGAGTLWVNALDTITATYNDADYGGTGPMTLTDTAQVDGAPPGAPTGLTVEWYGLVEEMFFLEEFEGDGTPTFAELGWTIGGASNDWQIGTPGGLGTPPDPTAAYEGTFSIGNDLTGLGTYAGEYEDSLAAESNWIYSAPMDCTGYTNVQVQFARYLGVESATYDHAYIEASTSPGGPWTQIWSHTATSAISDTAWSLQTYGIAPVADDQPAVYLRFELGATDGSVTYCGWNIDNLGLIGLTSGTMHNTLNWTLSPDDGAGADDVDHYNVYRSNSQLGPWDGTTLIATVPAGTGTYTDPNMGEFDGINWWYVVRAQDDIGNLDANTNAVPEVPLTNVPPSAPNNPTPSDGAAAVPLNPTLSVRAADPNGDVLTVRFYNAAGPTLIGTSNNVPSGTYANIVWNGLTPTTSYSWFATADDGEFVTQSATWGFTTIDTTPPGPPTGLDVEWTGLASGTALSESFAAGIPATWTIVDGGSGGGAAATWTAANPGGRTGVSPITTPFAIVDSDNAGTTATQDEQLITPVMNLGSATAVTLQFDQYFYRYQTEVCDVDVMSANTGGAWTNVYRITGASSPNPNHQTINISAQAAGASDAQVRFRYYNGQYDWYWMIDNILVTFVGGSTTDDNLLTWSLSPDDGAGADDVDHYNIYRSDVSSGPWDPAHFVNTAPAGTGSFTDTGRGEPDGINWWYVVRAEDIWGNEDTNTNAVPEIGSVTPPYEIDLAGRTPNSWVFVSFPSGLTGNIQDILNDAASGDSGTTWTVAKWYNPQTPADPWKTYRVGGQFNDMPGVSNQMGFWLYITANGGDQALTLGSYADIPATTNINLYAGWNLVGYPSATDRSGSTTPAAVDIISVYSGSATYTDHLAKGSVTLRHGNAYFMHCTANAVWTVNDP